MKITIRRPDDFHVHLRQGMMLGAVAPYTARQFGRALVMPNLSPPITTPAGLAAYRDAIVEATQGAFTPLMSFYITPELTPGDVEALKGAGAVAGKLYPQGVTTGSEAGVSNVKASYPVFDAMERLGLVLCLHGETPGEFVLLREYTFHRDLVEIARTFPALKIVLEHITDGDSVSIVQALPHNVAATITVHHLFLTLDDVVGDKIAPHAFCKPVAKYPSDREALVDAATSGNPKFFLGTDSAPHLRETKECASGCAGVFSAPCALEALFELFERESAIPRLENFVSKFGADFYGLPVNEGSVTFEQREWTVPALTAGVVPFMAGKSLRWRQV